MSRTAFIVGVFALAFTVAAAMAGNQTISTNTVWSGTVTVDGTVTVNSSASLTIQPGTTVNFVGTGNITFSSAGLFSAQGTAAAPIQFNGTQTGYLAGNPTGVSLSNCAFSGLGTSSTKWLSLNPSSSSLGFSMTNCSATGNTNKFSTGGSGPVTISGCSLLDNGELDPWANGNALVSITNNNIRGSMVWTQATSGSINVSHNVILNGTIWAKASSVNTTVVADNYIHDTAANSQYGILYTVGQIYNNVVRGCTWNLSGSGGHVYNNVIESLTAADAAARGDGTHENVYPPTDNSVFERNLFLNACNSGSIMTNGTSVGTGVVFRNNTFDQRGAVGRNSTACFWLNHLATVTPTNGMNIRNNLFLRGGRMYDEMSHPDSASYIDYNCWAGRTTDGWSGTSPTSPRFVNVSITGKVEGDDGFGMHDTMLPTSASGFDPASLVNNSNFVDPYSDADMLAGMYTNAQLLALYQQAYTPVAGSALINAGSPTDASDPAVAYGQIDIGAIEVALLPGDANTDRKVTFADYIELERNFGATNATWAMGDFNGDGKVTFADYIILEGGFGKSVPEPMSLSLLIVGLATLLRRKTH